MQIWFKGRGGRVRIPVLPSSYQVTSEQKNTIVNVIGLGDVVLKGKPGLRKITFSSFFPKRFDSSYCEPGGLKSPKSYVSKIETMKRGGRVKLTLTGTPVNFYCTIESFEWGENDGTGDVTYTLTLQEYRSVSAGKSVVVMDTPAPGPAAAEPAGPERPAKETGGSQSYTVQAGDCLSAIARKLTGSANWNAIYEQNKGTIGGNPNLIRPGQVLTIPGG